MLACETRPLTEGYRKMSDRIGTEGNNDATTTLAELDEMQNISALPKQTCSGLFPDPIRHGERVLNYAGISKMQLIYEIWDS